MLPSSASVERVSSYYKKLLTDERQTLINDSIRELLFLNINSKGFEISFFPSNAAYLTSNLASKTILNARVLQRVMRRFGPSKTASSASVLVLFTVSNEAQLENLESVLFCKKIGSIKYPILCCEK